MARAPKPLITKGTKYATNGKQILKLGLCFPNGSDYNPCPGFHWNYGNKLWPRRKGDNLAARDTIYSSWFDKGSELHEFRPIDKKLIHPDILAKLEK